MKKSAKIVISILMIVLLAIGGCLGYLYHQYKTYKPELQAIISLEEIGDDIYSFCFTGDYGFQEFLKQGGAKTDREALQYYADFVNSRGIMEIEVGDDVKFDVGCSTVQSNNLFCRSFDFGDKDQKMVVVRTYPKDAYASISTSSFAFLGFGDDWKPESSIEKTNALSTIYLPFDGMNEKGLCVADLIELDGDTTDYDTERPDLTITSAIRLVLDYAANVEEAIDLLGKYDFHASIGWAHHISIADDKRSVVVEWKKGQMHVTDVNIVTNHCIWEKRQHPLTVESNNRMNRLEAMTAPTNYQEVVEVLKEAAYDEWTIWSVMYDRRTMNGIWFIRRKWDEPISEKIISQRDGSSEFVNVSDVVPDAIFEIRYFSTYNFVGTRIDGYFQPVALLTKQAADSLKAVSDDVIKQGYRLKIYDAYRPQCAVDHFVRWSKQPSDTAMKRYFYPMLNKTLLFEQNYIMAKSGHSRGSTVDLTLFDMNMEKEVDMGGTFDWFGVESHSDFCGNPETMKYTGHYVGNVTTENGEINSVQFANRMILRQAMMRHGFKPLDSEWWHFTLNNEPFPKTYFDFPVRQIR